MSESQPAEEVTREEVRPGLTLIKRRVIKDDGRYLLYFDFERRPQEPTADTEAR